VGTTLTIASVWVPELVIEVAVMEVVPLITVTFAADVGSAEEVDWAAVERIRVAYRRRGRRQGTRISQGIRMMMDVGRRERPREQVSGKEKWACVREVKFNPSYIGLKCPRSSKAHQLCQASSFEAAGGRVDD
jgi:hypothetical protein